jgi:hypothetical protein
VSTSLGGGEPRAARSGARRRAPGASKIGEQVQLGQQHGRVAVDADERSRPPKVGGRGEEVDVVDDAGGAGARRAPPHLHELLEPAGGEVVDDDERDGAAVDAEPRGGRGDQRLDVAAGPAREAGALRRQVGVVRGVLVAAARAEREVEAARQRRARVRRGHVHDALLPAGAEALEEVVEHGAPTGSAEIDDVQPQVGAVDAACDHGGVGGEEAEEELLRGRPRRRRHHQHRGGGHQAAHQPHRVDQRGAEGAAPGPQRVRLVDRDEEPVVGERGERGEEPVGGRRGDVLEPGRQHLGGDVDEEPAPRAAAVAPRRRGSRGTTGSRGVTRAKHIEPRVCGEVVGGDAERRGALHLIRDERAQGGNDDHDALERERR